MILDLPKGDFAGCIFDFAGKLADTRVERKESYYLELIHGVRLLAAVVEIARICRRANASSSFLPFKLRSRI